MSKYTCNQIKKEQFMSTLRRTSRILDAARRRLAGLKSITPTPDFGGILKASDFETKINSVSAQIDSYNQLRSELDLKEDDIKRGEAELNDMSRRFLAATAAIFGPDSSQYEMIGGTRSERRPASRKRGS
jgi:hypothetical protein